MAIGGYPNFLAVLAAMRGVEEKRSEEPLWLRIAGFILSIFSTGQGPPICLSQLLDPFQFMNIPFEVLVLLTHGIEAGSLAGCAEAETLSCYPE